VVSFGLTNAPAVFMDTMNCIFHNYLYQLIVVFIDEILICKMICFKNQEEGGIHLEKTLERLQQEQLYAKLEKCEFWLGSMSFLGHVISREWVLVDPEKVKVVVEWGKLTRVHKIWSFLGLTGYY
jgi:hypothetical protein